MTGLVVVPQQVADLRGAHAVGGVDHAGADVNFGACQGSVAEKVFQSQDGVGVVLDVMGAETVPYTMGMKFRSQSAMLQAGLELMGENIGLQATCCFSGREHPVLWGFRPILPPIVAQRLVAGIRQYDPPFLVPLALGYPQEPQARSLVSLDIRELQLCQLECPHPGPIQGEEEGEGPDLVEMVKELLQLLHPEVDRHFVACTHIGNLPAVDGKAEDNLEEEPASCIVGVDAAALELVFLMQMQQEAPQVLLIQVGIPVLPCECAEADQCRAIRLPRFFRTPPKQKVLFHLFQYLFIRHH